MDQRIAGRWIMDRWMPPGFIRRRLTHRLAKRKKSLRCPPTGPGGILRVLREYNERSQQKGNSMSLAEVLPDVQSLSRLDKIRLIQIVAQGLEQDESDFIEAGQSYPVWSPDRAYSAAATMLEAVEL